MKISSILFALVVVAVGVTTFLWTTHFQLRSKSESQLREEVSILTKELRRMDPLSPEAQKITDRLLELREQREAEAENPGELMRILYERTIPYGEAVPGYEPGYRMRESQAAMRNASMMSAEVLPWIERGPGNVSGRARGLVVDPDDPTGNSWFVASVGGGIWKTTNGGTNWIEVAPYLANLAVSTIEMAPSNHNILYAGTGESMFSVDVINGDGILKSTDRGQTWFPLQSTLANPNFNNIARIIIDPSNPDIVLTATTTGRYKLDVANASGIWKTTNGGISWTRVYQEQVIGTLGRVKKVLQIIATPGDFNVQYAGIDQRGIFKSTNAGDSWFWSSVGIDDSTGRFELAIAPSNPNKVYAAAAGTQSILYYSSNAGESWIRTTGGNTSWLSSQGWYDNTICVHPTNENIVYVGGVNLYRHVVSGTTKTTTTLSTGPVHVDHHNLMIIPRVGGGFRILNTNDGGLGVSSDSSANWTKPTLGMNTSQFYGVDKKPGASAYFGGMQDNGTWRSPENSTASSLWTSQIGGDGYETSWHFNNPLWLIGGSQYNGIARSLNGGQSFSSATSGLATGSANAPFITKIAKTNMEPDLLFAVGAAGVYRSTNFGASWALTSIPSSTWGAISTFHDVRISRANPNIVWAGSRMDAIAQIQVSTNRGTTFQPTPVYNVTTMGGISGLATHPLQDSTAYVLFSFAQKPKILRTTNLGQTWEDISGFGSGSVSTNGFPDVAVYDMIVFPHQPSTLWVGTEIGLFESTDNGGTWHFANNGLPAVAIWFITHVEEEVVVATHGRGIWSVRIPGLSAGQTFSPLVKAMYQQPDGMLAINISLRSIYDSTVVSVNGTRYRFIEGNPAAVDTIVRYPVVQSGSVSAQAVSYKNGTAYASLTQSTNVVLFNAPQAAYVNTFNAPSSDFSGNGFSITTPTGFSNGAIHSVHPYANNQNYIYTLMVPIVVAPSNAFVAYDDIAIIEPGEAGSTFGDDSFYDYVVIEGTSDGVTWLPLADGYDATYDAAWLAAFNTSQSGNPTMYRHHEVNLLNRFSPGQTILLRLRLYADPGVTAWGWSIDNLEIQDRITGIAENSDGIPTDFSLLQNYPNPFNPSTMFRFQLPVSGKVSLKLFDVLGREVATIVNEELPAGSYERQWNAGTLASGMYMFRLQAQPTSGRIGMYEQIRKLVLTK
jgi:photosystem II stability/assembly factor-like uncharacterized protein